jgi:hypothetical protein
MKSPFLIIFIIISLLALNIASAADFHDQGSEHHALVVHHDSEPLASMDVDCDHECHISSHFLAVLSNLYALSSVAVTSIKDDTDYPVLNTIITPPSQPPKA